MFLDVLETVFNVCYGKDTEEGLTLPEVMESHCLSHLTSGFGVLERDIPRHFQAIDENGDGLVSRLEAHGLNRWVDHASSSKNNNNPWTMIDSNQLDSTQQQQIIQIATENKDTYGDALHSDEYVSFYADMIGSLKQEFNEDFYCFVTLKCCYYSYFDFGFDFTFFKIEDDDDMLVCWTDQNLVSGGELAASRM